MNASSSGDPLVVFFFGRSSYYSASVTFPRFRRPSVIKLICSSRSEEQVRACKLRLRSTIVSQRVVFQELFFITDYLSKKI